MLNKGIRYESGTDSDSDIDIDINTSYKNTRYLVGRYLGR